MSKYYGTIGFSQTVEISPGVWIDDIVEKQYFGELLSIKRSLSENSKVNDDIEINNRISILIDPYEANDFSHLKYVEFMGTKWKAKNIEVLYPRLIITLGGIYNG